jgi:hypothetical protein
LILVSEPFFLSLPNTELFDKEQKTKKKAADKPFKYKSILYSNSARYNKANKVIPAIINRTARAYPGFWQTAFFSTK